MLKQIHALILSYIYFATFDLAFLLKFGEKVTHFFFADIFDDLKEKKSKLKAVSKKVAFLQNYSCDMTLVRISKREVVTSYTFIITSVY